jgi:hypothetical protein
MYKLGGRLIPRAYVLRFWLYDGPGTSALEKAGISAMMTKSMSRIVID